jgi:hypothetical protein
VLQSRCHTRYISQLGPPGAWSEASTPLSWPNGEVAMDKFNVNDLVDLLASMEDTVGRVTGVRDGGTRIRVLWQHRRGYEGYTTIHDSSALRKLPAAK